MKIRKFYTVNQKEVDILKTSTLSYIMIDKSLKFPRLLRNKRREDKG